MKRFFWKLFNHKNYPTSKELTDLVYKCMNLIKYCPNVTVHISQFEINIKTSSSHIKLWNENKYYSWLSNGSVNGRKFEHSSPSLDAIYDFKTFLKNEGYNIYVVDGCENIRIDDVKC